MAIDESPMEDSEPEDDVVELSESCSSLDEIAVRELSGTEASNLLSHPLPYNTRLARIIYDFVDSSGGNFSIYRLFSTWRHDNAFHTDIFEWKIYSDDELNLY